MTNTKDTPMTADIATTAGTIQAGAFTSLGRRVVVSGDRKAMTAHLNAWLRGCNGKATQ